METTLNAASNPAMANKLLEDVNKIVAQEVMAPTAPEVVIPSLPETTVDLPGGLYDPCEGNVMKTAEVRELTGLDEEAIVRISEPGKALLTILEKATVSVGGQPVTKDTLG